MPAAMPAPGVLHVIGGTDRGKRFDLTLAETRIGRGADQDVVLSDIAVSRRHVTVHVEGNRYRLKDLGSGNGSLVNGQRVDTHLLNHGDHIEIGQTVMRFEHVGAPSAQAGPPPAYVAPSPPRQMPPAPSAAVNTQTPFGAPPAGMPVETPSDAIQSPPASLPRAAPFATGQRSGPDVGPLDTPLKQALVFGGMGLLSIIGIIIILSRTVMAKPPVVTSEAEELYRQGLRLFGAGDYEGAKISFNEALVQVPDSPESKRYVRLCETEVQARGALKNAERALSSKRYVEAVKSLDQVESSSTLYDQVRKLRKENAPRAAAEDVEEARRLSQEDSDTARARLQQALELDPTNEEARSLAAKLKAGVPLPPPVAEKDPDPPPPPAPPVKEKDPPPVAKDKHASRKDRQDKEELAPVKLPPPKGKDKEAGKEASPAPLSGGAMAAYKAKDFAGAEKAFRLEALNQPAKVAQKSLDTANQVRQLKQLIDRAASEEAGKPDAAAKDYEDAMSLDAKLGKGVHAAFFKSKIGKLQLSAAQAAFTQGKYDVAYSTVLNAQRAGAGDGGLLKQLESKAGELVQKGAGVQKSNVNQAKQFWRMVIRMVPTSSASYAKAYQLLNNAGAAHKDEDED
jgi:tetratricopeptide (TPR) repeat protein